MAAHRLNELQERFSRMCGLVVMLGLGGRQADAAVLSQMARSIAHRGPDDSGLYLHQQVGFGFRRLAILDLSPTGHQPMCSEDGELVIVFNGEIYNYIELREELRAAGHCFRRSEEHTSELQSPDHLVCRLLLEKKKKIINKSSTT